MTDYAGEPVTIRVVDPVDARGHTLTNLNATATITISSPDETIVHINNAAMTWDAFLVDGATVNAWAYDWDTTGRSPGAYLAKVTVTPSSSGLGSVEYVAIDLADRAWVSPEVTCGDPWVEPADLECLSTLSESDRELVVSSASGMLFNATARQFIGTCVDVVRPPSANIAGGDGMVAWQRLADGSTWLGLDGLSTLPESTFPAWGPTADVVASPVMVHSTIHLPGFPVIDVTKITINGTDLPAGSWRIVDDRWVIRADGLSWPLWQRLDRAAGQPDTWTIEYRWGVPIPSAGILAARVLSCELGLSLKGDSACRLPKRLQSINRENLQAVVLDPFTFLDKGRFGIYEIDAFVMTANPHQLTRDGKVINVDLIGSIPRRIR